MQLPTLRGRGSHINPPTRFSRFHVESDPDSEPVDRDVPTQYFADDSKSVVSENDSPDVPFRFSVNPYRGCAHGCAYCFARPTHEYLDHSPGLDFESKIIVKRYAPQLFRQWLARPKYLPEVIAISGVTDCYQPIEKNLKLTRQCLEVALACRQPIGIVTKNTLVLRDIDILREMAALNLVGVSISVTTLDQGLAKVMEPRTSAPAARLRAIRELSAANIPVGVLVAPVIPALTDHEIPAILEAVKNAGARNAGYVLLRLPGAVKEIFFEWLARTQPLQKGKVESRIRATRGGELYQNAFGSRMRGGGEVADTIADIFRMFARKFGLDGEDAVLDASQFIRPAARADQPTLF